MKTTRKDRNGEPREERVKKYILTPELLALLKRVGGAVAKSVPRGIAAPLPVPVKVRR